MTIERAAPSLRGPQAEAIQLRGTAFEAGSLRCARDDARVARAAGLKQSSGTPRRLGLDRVAALAMTAGARHQRALVRWQGRPAVRAKAFSAKVGTGFAHENAPPNKPETETRMCFDT